MCAAAAALMFSLGCGTAAPPPDAEYPALVFPAHLPPKAASKPAGPAARPTASAAEPPSGPPGASSDTAPGLLARASPAGSPPTPPAGPAPSPTDPARSVHGDLPDPKPLTERAWWSYAVTYDRGAITLAQPGLVCLARPEPTARRIGRFAFELWLGRELIDRLRFDFPLLGGEEPPAGPRHPAREAPRFAPGAHVSVLLRIPASDRATSARVLDRATGDVHAVIWPPRAASGDPLPRACPAPRPPTSRP